jgi:hypothetical protein
VDLLVRQLDLTALPPEQQKVVVRLQETGCRRPRVRRRLPPTWSACGGPRAEPDRR